MSATLRDAPVKWDRQGRRFVEIQVKHELRRAEPSAAQIHEWLNDGRAEALDGCIVEPDGTCPHGSPSWLIELGLI